MALSLLPTAALADEAGTKPVKIDKTTGETTEYETLDAAITAAKDGDTITILKAAENESGYKLNGNLTYSGKAITIKAADGTNVKFDMSAAVALHGAKITFEGVTFDYKTNGNYIGIQHADTLVYNNCTINGQVFLYAASETFNGCTFNQDSAGAYNVWTYAAKKVEFNHCAFNCVGRSVLVYNEGAVSSTDLTVTDTEFKASAPVEGKAAIEIDTSRMDGQTKITVDQATARQTIGFGTGSNSESSLWNDKKQNTDSNKNTTVVVADTTVFAPPAVAKIGDTEYPTLAAAIAAAKDGDTVKLLQSCNGNGIKIDTSAFNDKGLTVDFGGNAYTVGGVLVGSAGTGTNAFQLLAGGKVTFKNGKIIGVAEGTKPAEDTPNWHGAPAMMIQNYCDLTLYKMEVVGGDETVYTMSNNHGDVVIEDSTITAGGAKGYSYGPYAFDACGYSTYTGVSVTVRNSTINGDIEVSRSNQNKNSVKLALESGTVSGALKIDSSIQRGDATAITKTENVLLDAPNGYTWTKVGNTGVLVKEDSAAVVNGVGYTTLAAALNAVKNGETITLLKDVDENVTILAGKSITLDLNGKTINGGTGTSSAAITNYGTVTITDSSTEKAGTIKRSDIGTEGETSYYVIRNLGKMTITAANVINNSGYAKTNPSGSMVGSSLICNGDGDAPATLTINGGAFEQQNFIVVKNGSFGILNVNGGKFTSKHSAIQNWYKADIKGGEINGQLWTDAWQEGSSVGETKIGGTAKFTGEIVMDIAGSVKPTLEISGGEMIVSNWRIAPAAANKGAKPVVTGGNFSQPVKREYLDSSLNAELKRASGKTPYSYYTSMDVALAAAKPGDTVTDLNATTEQKVTLTLKYNDGATADTTYNVASGTTITLPAPAHRSGYTFNGWYDGSTKVSSSYKVTKNVTLTASWSYNYSGGSSSYDPTYSVSTPSKTKNGSVTVSPKSASKGDTVTVTVKPDSGYVLETLTVTDKNGNELTLKDKGNGKYTFTMPAGKVEVKATFMEDNSMLNFFYDVPNNAYFYEAVKWAVENGITTGVGNDLFAPEQPCTRAQIVTFLWRAAGSPEPKAASSFADVAAGSYYAKAVAWAVENGITTGTGDGKFSPDATCTRAQAVTFLARALSAKASGKAEFSDVPADSYFADAVAWAAANGVTEGIGGGLFGSDNDCTRGQIVTFLYRAYNK